MKLLQRIQEIHRNLEESLISNDDSCDTVTAPIDTKALEAFFRSVFPELESIAVSVDSTQNDVRVALAICGARVTVELSYRNTQPEMILRCEQALKRFNVQSLTPDGLPRDLLRPAVYELLKSAGAWLDAPSDVHEPAPKDGKDIPPNFPGLESRAKTPYSLLSALNEHLSRLFEAADPYQVDLMKAFEKVAPAYEQILNVLTASKEGIRWQHEPPRPVSAAAPFHVVEYSFVTQSAEYPRLTISIAYDEKVRSYSGFVQYRRERGSAIIEKPFRGFALEDILNPQKILGAMKGIIR